MFEQLKTGNFLNLLMMGAKVSIPTAPGTCAEQNYGPVGFSGLIAAGQIELELFGETYNRGSLHYFPLSMDGLLQAIAFASSEIETFVDIGNYRP